MTKTTSFPAMAPPPPPSDDISRILPRQIGTGVQSGQQMLGGPKVQVNSGDGNIIVSDGTNDRIIIGYQADGF